MVLIGFTRRDARKPESRVQCSSAGACNMHVQEFAGKKRRRKCQLWLRICKHRFADTDKLLYDWLLYGYLKYGSQNYVDCDPDEECDHRADGVLWRTSVYKH